MRDWKVVRKRWTPCGWILAALLPLFPARAAPVGAPPDASRARVVAATTDMAVLAAAIGGGHVRVDALIPSASCPGHVDLRPAQWEILARADLVLVRGFEALIPVVRRQADPDRVVTVSVEGHWMIPAVQRRAAQAVADRMSLCFPAHDGAFQDRLRAVLDRIDAVETAVRPMRERFRDVAVVADVMNASWIRWMGFNVVAEVRRDENVSPAQLEAIFDQGRRGRAVLVIENRQSAGRAGRWVAERLNAGRVTLSNFPAWTPEDPLEAYPRHLETSMRRLLEALDRRTEPAP